MDVEKFIPNDKNILDELLNNKNDATKLEGSTEDFMKLEVNESYKNNKERLQRQKSYMNLNEKKSID